MKKWRLFAIGDPHGRIATVEALTDFLVREASLIAQKTIVDYCHMKTRLPLNELTREQAFTDAFEESRQAGFAAVLSDLVAVVESHLRAAAGASSGHLPAALAALYRDALGRFAGAAKAGFGDAGIRQRLAQLQIAAPKSSADIALTSGNILFDTLPLHPRLRKHDREPVVEGARFLFMSRCQRLGERLDAPRLAAALLADGDAAAAGPGTASA